jgi:hypothetical protein
MIVQALGFTSGSVGNCAPPNVTTRTEALTTPARR